MTHASGPHETALEAVIGSVRATDPANETAAWARLDSLTKPPRSLGRLEELAARVARVQGTDHPTVARKAIVLAAADHGVVAEGISAYPQDVTWQMVANFSAGGAAINALARSAGADVLIYDVGVAKNLDSMPGVRHCKVAPGTANMAQGPAMSAEQCAEAVMVGVDAARSLADEGCTLIGTGEMGIGNTTSAAALTAAFVGCAPEDVVGRGTGIDDTALAHKVEVVRRALEVNEVGERSAFGVLSAVGGLEIAMLAGVVLGCAERGVCVVTDGFISSAATLAAVSMCPAARDYVFPSHLSVEPGHRVALDALGLDPVLELDMRLGEGTGAALAFGIIEAACRMISEMATFAEAGVSAAEDAS